MNGPKESRRGWNAEERKEEPKGSRPDWNAEEPKESKRGWNAEERKEEPKESNLDANRQCFHFAVNLDAAVKNRYSA